MSWTWVGGDLEEIRAAARALDELGRGLDRSAARLRGALDALRASPGWWEHLGDVPPSDVDVAAVAAAVSADADVARQVADALEEADRPPGLLRTRIDLSGLSPTGPRLLRLDGRTILDTGDGDQRVVLRAEADGRIVVDVTGPHGYWYRELDDVAGELVLRTGDGDDVVQLGRDVRLRLHVWTGAGHDVVAGEGTLPLLSLGADAGQVVHLGAGDDEVLLGAGADVAYGGDGDDQLAGQLGADLLVGGAGADALYGGRGRDRLRGGAGDDRLEGGRGEDDLAAGYGDDVASGGRGADVVRGDAGDDLLVGGRGGDTLQGRDGADLATRQPDDAVTGAGSVFVRLEGSPGSRALVVPRADGLDDDEQEAWEERVDAELELLRALPPGRALLGIVDDSAKAAGRRVAIRPAHPRADGGEAPARPPADDGLAGPDRVPGSYVSMPSRYELGTPDGPLEARAFGVPGVVVHRDVELGLDPSNTRLRGFGPFVEVELFHELAHVEDKLHGGIAGTTLVEVFDGPEGLRVVPLRDAEAAASGFALPTPAVRSDGTTRPRGAAEPALRALHPLPDERRSYESRRPGERFVGRTPDHRETIADLDGESER